jgi:hypothetical protein
LTSTRPVRPVLKHDTVCKLLGLLEQTWLRGNVGGLSAGGSSYCQPSSKGTVCIARCRPSRPAGASQEQQCGQKTATGSQFCHWHKFSTRAVSDRLSLLTAIQEGREGGPLLGVNFVNSAAHVFAKQDFYPGDILTFVSGAAAEHSSMKCFEDPAGLHQHMDI